MYKTDHFSCQVTIIVITIASSCQLQVNVIVAMNIFLFSILTLSLTNVSLGDVPPDYETSGLFKCPTWHYLDPVGKCRCGSQLQGMIKCEPKRRVQLISFQCMTYDNISDVTVTGSCPYSRLMSVDKFYVKPPADVTELNNFTCGRLKRRGLLCSHCEDSLGVAVLTYSYECTRCLGNFHGWLLYFTLALVPITLFFLIVIFCNIQATAPHMNTMLCGIQIVLYNFNTHPSVFYTNRNYVLITYLTILGIWNLDFFRYIYPPFCISIHFSTLQVLAFEYIIAFYPLLLIIITYIGIELYDKNYRVIVLMWKPFNWCLSQVQKYYSLDLNSVKYSIINAFASFFVLSYSKILFTCCNIISFTQKFAIDGSIIQENNINYYLFYNASVAYFSPQHKPYFIFATTILTFFHIFPMFLLFVYPTKTFQKTIGYFTQVRWHFLHVFMDSFQGCYKNGTNNTRDYRYFAGIYLLIRIVFHFPDVFGIGYRQIIMKAIKFLMPFIASFLFGILRPYKNDIYNRLDCGYLGLLAFSEFWVLVSAFIAQVPMILLYVTASIPVIHTFLFLAYSIFLKVSPRCLNKKVIAIS